MAPHSGPLEEALAACLTNREARSQLRKLTTFPQSNIDFSSNAYLSLHSVPDIHDAFLSAVKSKFQSPESGAKPMLHGLGGSRLLDGNSTDAESLERFISLFHNAEAGLLFNSGYGANVSFFSCVPQPGDIIVYDELVHASVHDGMRMSRAEERIAFRHNSVEEDSRTTSDSKGKASLCSVLEALTEGEQGRAAREGRMSIFIAIESVYSMDGDVAPLKEMVACVERHLPRGNGYIVVDEAHSTGLFGDKGRGLVCELGLETRVFARLHTFGKALSALGGKSKPPSSSCHTR
jgi:8-amino-7-oxononanoate synthase